MRLHLPGNEAACPTGCARRGYPAAGPGPRRPWSLPQERNSPGRLLQQQGLCQSARALPFVDRRTVGERGNGPCGGRPLRRLRATPPLSGEARPKSRLRRLAVGLLAQPFGGTVPAGRTPPSPAGDTSPFRGGRPKSRLRRLAVGLLAQPFGGTIYGRVCVKEYWPCRPIRPSGRGFKQRLPGEDGANGGVPPSWPGSANRGRG